MESKYPKKPKNSKRWNKRKNKKKTNKSKESAEENKIKEQFIQFITKLEDFKKLIIAGEISKSDPNLSIYDNIFHYDKFKVLNFNKIKDKILSIFNTDKIDDIFIFLFKIFCLVIEFYIKNDKKTQKNKKETKENYNEETQVNESEKKINNENENNENNNNINQIIEEKKDEKKEINLNGKKSVFNKCYQLFNEINFFTVKNLIMNTDNELKNKTTEFLENNLLIIKKIYGGSGYFLYLYINIFDIKENLLNKINDEQNSNSQLKLDLKDNNIYLNLHIISALNLQNKYTLDVIFQKIADNLMKISPLLYSVLIRVYPNKEIEIINHISSLLKMKNNVLISYNLLYRLLYDDFKNNDECKKIILNMINQYMMIPFTKGKLFNPKINDNLYYCKIIFDNEDYFPENTIDKAKKYICNYFNSLKIKGLGRNIQYLKIFEKKDLDKYLNVYYFYDLLYKTKKFQNICIILKFIPKEAKNYLNSCSDKKTRKKIIKTLNLPQEEGQNSLDPKKIYPFLQFKLKEVIAENNPTALIDYALISQETYDAVLTIAIKKYKPEREDKDLYLYIMNELYYAPEYITSIILDEKKKSKIDLIFSDIDYVDKYSFEDYYGPVTKNCYTINMNETKIEFVNSTNQFEDICKQYFSETKYIGIDTEWQMNLTVREMDEISIMQLCDYEQKCCLILDITKLKHETKFMNEFINIFKGKIFIGYSFTKNDLFNMPKEMRQFFISKCEIYDLRTIYLQKYLEKAPCLKVMFETLEKIPLCKYEQCSDWELRPLRKTQLHYAALDALACILLYKNLLNVK